MEALEITKSGKDERRSTILEVAREVFLREGYAGTSMSQIAANLGGSKATLYSYFPSKKDLFIAVVDAECVKVLDLLYIVSETVTDIRTALQCFCRRSMTHILSDDVIAFYRMVIAESARFPEVGQVAYEFGFKRGVERMAAFIEKAIEVGLLRKVNARTAAEYLLDLSTGYLHKLRLWGVIENVSPEAIDSHVEAMVNIFLAVYGNDELSREARQFTGL